MTESQLNTINFLTESEYEAAKAEGNIDENSLYITPEIETNETQNGR